MSENTLFDFEIEIEPILQVLMRKTVEDSIYELCEEAEILENQKKRVLFLKKRVFFDFPIKKKDEIFT